MAQQVPQKRGVNWTTMGFVLIGFLVYFNYDPIADILGRKYGMWFVNGFIILAIIFSSEIDRFFRNRRS